MFKIFKRLTTKELSMIILAVIFVCLNVYLNLKIPDYMFTYQRMKKPRSKLENDTESQFYIL